MITAVVRSRIAELKHAEDATDYMMVMFDTVIFLSDNTLIRSQLEDVDFKLRFLAIRYHDPLEEVGILSDNCIRQVDEGCKC